MIPKYITAGDTLEFEEVVSDYGPDDGWALSYVLAAGVNRITITSADNGDNDYLVTETAANTAKYSPDKYRWQSYVTKGAERHSVSSGVVTIKPNFAGGAVDNRGHVESTLAAVEALLQNKPVKDVESYSIHGRSLSSYSFTELLTFRDKYKRELKEIEKAADLEAGIANSSKVYTRLAV